MEVFEVIVALLLGGAVLLLDTYKRFTRWNAIPKILHN